MGVTGATGTDGHLPLSFHSSREGSKHGPVGREPGGREDPQIQHREAVVSLVAPWVSMFSPTAGGTAGSQDVTGLEANQNLSLGAGTTGGGGLEHLLNSS